VGLRLLSVAERTDATRRAQVVSEKNGAAKWDVADPLCTLAMYAEVVALAAFDVDDPQCRAPWVTAEELRTSNLIGQENLAYLYEAYEAFEADHCIRADRLTAHEFSQLVWKLASGDQSPLDRLRLGTLRTCLRTLAAQHISLMNAISLSSLASVSGHSTTPAS
jgi:hypothetical protein